MIELANGLVGTLFDADATTVALVIIYIRGLAAHFDLEAADEATDFFHLAVGHQVDVGVCAHGGHLGGQDAGRAVQGREGFVEHGHIAADGGLTLHQMHLYARVRQIQGGLNAGDAGTHHQGGGLDLDPPHLQGFVVTQSSHGTGHQAHGLLRGQCLVGRHPGALLADVGDLHQEGIQTRIQGRLAKSSFMHEG